MVEKKWYRKFQGIPVRPRTRVTLTSLTGTFADSILTYVCVGERQEVVVVECDRGLREVDIEMFKVRSTIHTQNWRCARYP